MFVQILLMAPSDICGGRAIIWVDDLFNIYQYIWKILIQQTTFFLDIYKVYTARNKFYLQLSRYLIIS